MTIIPSRPGPTRPSGVSPSTSSAPPRECVQDIGRQGCPGRTRGIHRVHGLLENLVVCPQDPDSDGTVRFAVIAGGRRLETLNAIAADIYKNNAMNDLNIYDLHWNSIPIGAICVYENIFLHISPT